MQTLEKKKFVLYFNPNFAGGERVQLVEMDFFTQANGFRAEDVRDISKMGITPPSNILSISALRIWRVK